MPALLQWLLMLGPQNPIAVRLVQNGSRRRKHLYIRSGYLALLIAAMLWLLMFSTGAGETGFRDLAAAGARTFTWIAALQIALICLIAPVFMAGAIAQESDPKTWDIVLTTPLGSFQIVLGHLLGRLFFVLALLLASLPLFALTQFFGGVPGRSIFASTLIAAAAALLVGSIAIALAVSRVAGKRAVFLFYVAVITYLGVTAAADAWMANAGKGAGPGGQGVTPFTAINPFLALRALLTPSEYPRATSGEFEGLLAFTRTAPIPAWVVGSTALSVVLVVASSLTVRLGGVAGIGKSGTGVPLHRRIMGLGASGAEHRPPRAVWTNPIAWREAAARNATLGRIAARWSFIAFGLALGLGLVIALHVGGLTPSNYRFALLSVVWTEVAVITLVAINMSATAISREREEGALDLVLTTPITPGAYLTGKLRGLIAYLLPMLAVPVLSLAFGGLYALSGGLGNPDQAVVTDTLLAPGGTPTPIDLPVVLPEAPIIALLTMTPFIAFCVMVGLQWSLKSKGAIGSVISSVGVLGAIAGLVGLCAWNALSSIAYLGPGLSAMSPASSVLGLVSVDRLLAETYTQGGALASARLWLAVGAVASAIVYAGLVAGIHSGMKRGFDVTVRRLAGTG